MRATIENTAATVKRALGGEGSYMFMDGITYDLDARSLAKWLESCGYTVISYEDTGSYGLVVLSNGVHVSSNGHCALGGGK